MARGEEPSGLPTAVRIDALIDEMERCAWIYGKSPNADERAEAYDRYRQALLDIDKLRRDRAREMAAVAASTLAKGAAT